MNRLPQQTAVVDGILGDITLLCARDTFFHLSNLLDPLWPSFQHGITSKVGRHVIGLHRLHAGEGRVGRLDVSHDSFPRVLLNPISEVMLPVRIIDHAVAIAYLPEVLTESCKTLLAFSHAS